MAKLITGGTGVIGSVLSRILVERGEDVVIFDITINHGRIADIEDKVKAVRGDLGNWSEVLNVVKDNKITEIYHMGALLSGASEINPWASFRANVTGIYNVLEAARLFNVKKMMFTSTMGTFGLNSEGQMSDTTIQRPTFVYGVAKLYGEGLGRFYHNKFGLDFRAIRYPGIIGPGIRTVGHWAPLMIENAVMGKPYSCPAPKDTPATPRMFIKDAARAADMVLQAPKENIKMMHYNVSGVSSLASAEDIEQSIKKFIPDTVITYNPTPEIIERMSKIPAIKSFDDSYAQKEWGWKPECTTCDQMVSAYIDEMRTHPERYGLE